MAVNLRSQVLTCKHAIPDMVRTGGGSIINMSSGASLKGDRTRTAYGVSKAGVNALTMYAATGHGKQGSGSTPSCPGSSSPTPSGPTSPRRWSNHSAAPPSRRSWVSPTTSPTWSSFWPRTSPRYITGQMIAIDGGMSAHVGTTASGSRGRLTLRLSAPQIFGPLRYSAPVG